MAALTGPVRKSQAEDTKRRLQEIAGYPSEVFPSEDGRYYRVIIIGYTDRKSAQAVCVKLKQKAGFYDAWVRELPK